MRRFSLIVFLMLALAGLLVARSLMTSNLEATVIQTSRSGDKLKVQQAGEFRKASNTPAPVIELFPEEKFQTLVGIGGSFTESTAHVLQQLSPIKRKQVIDAYFSQEGSAYSLTRTHINSCDFSLDHYAYTEDNDLTLESFSLDHDLKILIPLIKDAQQASGAEFKIIASPWTAPPWMKDNNSWYGGSLKPGMEEVWARYINKYLQTCRDLGISIWGITPENEPLGNGEQWESMIFTPDSMRDFIRDHLGPELAKNSWDTKILIFDQNRDEVEEWADVILSDPEAAKFIWGTAVHWYSSTIDWLPEALNSVHQKFPDKHLLHSEGCVDNQVPVWQDDDWYWRKEATDWGYTWAREEDKPNHPPYVPVYRYARDIIGGLNSWLTGWVDWNLVLDTQGGPNHAENWCCAPVIAKPETDEVYFTPMYYALAHFSKYLRPGAQRIAFENPIEELMVTAVENPDGSLAVVVLNQGKEPQDFSLRLKGQDVEMMIPGEALQTVILR